MTDPTQFIVQHSWIHRIMNHQGILGKGRDFLSNKPCSLHYYIDNFKRNYVMQLYQSIDSQFLTTKLNRMAKTAHSQYVSNMARPCMFSSRKTSKGLYDFAIFYDVTGIYGMSLESVMGIRTKNKQKFQEQQLNGFFWQICDMFLLSSQNTQEYLQITPMNIFCKIEGTKGYNFFPNNFGLHFTNTKWEKKYHNPKDQFWNGKKNPQSALRASMFMLGMVLLQMSCLLPSDDLYQEIKQNQQLSSQNKNQINTGPILKINQKTLSKRIEGIKLINDKLISNVITKLLIINQHQRLKISDIYNNQEWMKLRRVDFIQNKAKFSNFKSFYGLVSYEKDFAVGQGLDSDMCLHRGTFRNNFLDGPGLKQLKNGVIQIGLFQNGIFREGQQVIKNKYITIGTINNFQNQNDSFQSNNKNSIQSQYKISKGIRIALNIGMLNKQNKKLVAYSGQFNKQGEAFKGTVFYNDGSKQIL